MKNSVDFFLVPTAGAIALRVQLSYTRRHNLAVSTNPDSVAAGDFIGNSKQDFAMTDDNDSTVSILFCCGHKT